ncbi:hypothetical protein HYY74_06560 [Candidatus Woesearchaeota archaeon]|nr:hypothetical protein [Candidatus Woesearchaeota archaeon]
MRQAISDGVVADLYVYPEEEGKFIQYYRTHGLPVPDQAELESYRELTKLAMFTTPAPGGFTMEGHQMPVPVLLHQRIYNNKSNTNRDLHAVIKHEVTHAYDYFFGITNLPNNRANKKLVVELRGNHDGLSDILEDFARFNKYTGSEEYFTDAALNYGTLYVFAEYITQGMQLPVQAAQKRDIESSVKALLLYEPEEYYALKSEERLMLASSMLPLKGISARLTNYQGTQAILIHPDSKYKARGDFLVTITDLSR